MRVVTGTTWNKAQSLTLIQITDVASLDFHQKLLYVHEKVEMPPPQSTALIYFRQQLNAAGALKHTEI